MPIVEKFILKKDMIREIWSSQKEIRIFEYMKLLWRWSMSERFHHTDLSTTFSTDYMFVTWTGDINQTSADKSN